MLPILWERQHELSGEVTSQLQKELSLMLPKEEV